MEQPVFPEAHPDAFVASLQEIELATASILHTEDNDRAIDCLTKCVAHLKELATELRSQTSVKEKFLIETEIKSFEIFRDYYKHEDQLIISRTNSFLSIQGFLFAALGASATATDNPRVKALQFLIPTIGAVAAVIYGARHRQQKNVYRSLEKDFSVITKSSLYKHYFIQSLRYPGVGMIDNIILKFDQHVLFIIIWMAAICFMFYTTWK